MAKAKDLREIPDLPEEIRDAALDGHLVIFVGAGVSYNVGLPSWAKLATLALEELCELDLMNYSEMDQLNKLDPKKQLSIAKLIAHENSREQDLIRYLETEEENKGIYKYLNRIGCACVTTNYDLLLAPCFNSTHDATTTKPFVRRISNKNDFYVGELNTPGTVIHLHGSIQEPSTMIVTTKDYLEHYDNDNVQTFLRNLFEQKSVLFIGYGLEEVEILEHILRRGHAGKMVQGTLYSLQGFFKSEEPLYLKLHEYYLKSFGVNLIGFIKDFKKYKQLDDIIINWSNKIEVNDPALSEDLDFMEKTLNV